MMRYGYRKGFTLIELLVVIGIMAILLGLLLPAIQKIRESGQRLQCQNNLRQIGLALHTYHDHNKSFPSGVVSITPGAAQYYWSWMSLLLPYIEQGNLYTPALTWGQSNSSPWFPPNPALGVVVSTYTCTADGRTLVADFGPQGVKGLVAFTSYQGVSSGSSADFTTADDSGIFYTAAGVGSTTRLNDITDGTSHTLMVGERPPSADLIFGWWFAGWGWDGSSTGDVVLGAREVNFTTNLGPLYYPGVTCPPSNVGLVPGNLQNSCDQSHFWSLHSGGANFLMADGSVHFFPYSANAILPALATRAGGEVVSLASY